MKVEFKKIVSKISLAKKEFEVGEQAFLTHSWGRVIEIVVGEKLEEWLEGIPDNFEDLGGSYRSKEEIVAMLIGEGFSAYLTEDAEELILKK